MSAPSPTVRTLLEPEQLTALYHVSLKRLSPVGLVYLWPTTAF